MIIHHGHKAWFTPYPSRLVSLVLVTLLTSFTKADDFRPLYHFAPDQNWMNEPNGLIKIGSKWHLFFQHNPTGNFWGNLSWGHAISADLVDWTHLPIAISSANGIQAFTGTSYFDEDNTSGLGTSESLPYLAFYTGYFPDTAVQDQRLAYSLDQGETWIKYNENPIISQAQEKPHDNPGHGPRPRRAKQTIILDILRCQGLDMEDDLTAADIPGLPRDITGWEVPDLFELPIEGSPDTKWVLIITPAQGSPAGGNGVFAVTGSFDGTSFTPDPVDPTKMWLDFGRDWDGAYSWENVPTSDGRKILASVMNSYGVDPPANTWKEMLSFPRTLQLRDIDRGVRFIQQTVHELDSHGTSLVKIVNETLEPVTNLFSEYLGTVLDIGISSVLTRGSILSLAVYKGNLKEAII
ncbi:inulinase [Fusarium subglutinans]|uniref:Inulinase n=1 Tax=Gibberella subglutinans TaxID=42677 RepID=A0A8H5PTU8_GIBSU|nr:inulinase [Fusarium subglutinans]KAF5602892.1 inulinase [Fusarium subglutinans]